MERDAEEREREEGRGGIFPTSKGDNRGHRPSTLTSPPLRNSYSVESSARITS